MEENYCWALGQFKAPFQVVALIAGHAEPRFHSLPTGTLRSRGMLTAVGTAGAREVPVFFVGAPRGLPGWGATGPCDFGDRGCNHPSPCRGGGAKDTLTWPQVLRVGTK